MANIWVIAKREYLINAKRVAFLLFTFGVPLLALIVLLGGALFSGIIGNYLESQFEGERTTPRIVGVVEERDPEQDQSGEGEIIGTILPAYQDRFQLFDDEARGIQALRNGEISTLMMLPVNYLESGDVRVVTLDDMGGISGIGTVGSGELRTFLVAHLLRDQLEPPLRDRLINPISLTRETIEPVAVAESDPVANTSTDTSTVADESAAVGNIMFGYFFGIILGIAVFSSAGYLLQGVARDKSDRIVEILLSSVSARQLLAGKVLGLGALGLTQLFVWIGSLMLIGLVGTTSLGVTPIVFEFLFARPEFLLLDVLYFILGFLLYALLMGTVGALGTSQQESQQIAGIFTFLAVIPFMLGGIFLSNPDATLARALSWFPITAPTAMLLRLPLSPALPWIDIVVSLVGIVVMIVLTIWIGGKVFRLGLLIYGQRPSIGRVWRALREA